jgi:hypothetical protein
MSAHILLLAILCTPMVSGIARQGVRVVDSVDVSVARDEASHAFAGVATQIGEAAERKWRSATGWFSYSLRIYDDSPLTLVFLLSPGAGDRETFDVLLDGRKVATVDRGVDRQTAEEVKFDVPFAETKGNTTLTVKLQAHRGSRTARVLEIRTLQEHLE